MLHELDRTASLYLLLCKCTKMRDDFSDEGREDIRGQGWTSSGVLSQGGEFSQVP